MLMAINKDFLVGYKLLFGLVGFSAIVTEIAVLIERGTFKPANFFSFFTIEGNILAIIVLFLGALAIVRGKSGFRMTMLRGATTLYILIVGIGFAILLSGLDNTRFTAVPWDNIVLHYIMPVVMLIDWIIDPPKVRIELGKVLYWLVFPIVYVVYTLARGVHVKWYPYPFLDPSIKGYGHIAMMVALLLILGFILTWLLVRAAKVLGTARNR